MRRAAPWFIALSVILACVCVMFARTASPAPFAYDESDYMYAGTQGFAANYLDRGSLSMFSYISRGLDLLRNKSERGSMSQFVRNAGGLDFYRHYHGPVYAYWISLWHALGVRQEASYRATGLVLHALGAILIFWMFRRVFADLPVAAAFVAAAVFAMNRTALVAATSITQHVVFAFLACAALFAVAEFLRTRENKYWYAAAGLMAASFAAVEISSVMIGSVMATVAWFERERGWKGLLALFARGAACFIATLAVLWPRGVIQLNAVKGYLYLAYIAVARKTFTPISPLDLWGFKVRAYPLEFVLLFGAMVAGAAWLWRTGSFRRAAPFLFYGIIFFGVTMVVTAPYTYYHASLTMALSVVTGVLFGELWNRAGAAARGAGLALVMTSLVLLDAGFYRETAREYSEKPQGTAELLAFLNSHPSPGPLLVPYTMVPPLHFYRPELVTSSYDEADGGSVSAQAATLKPGMLVVCRISVCRQLDQQAAARAEQIGSLPDGNQPLYAMRLGN